MTKAFVCQRCGRCCLEVGRTFWKGGDFDKHPALNALANDGDYEDGGLSCEMLRFEGGKAVCLIQKNFGHEAKPKACREFPGDDDECHRLAIMQEQINDKGI